MILQSNLKKRNMKFVYLQCYFVTIATILGTGILGLPVTLVRSGLYPFLISFFIGFLAQSLLIIFFTEILQRTEALQFINYNKQICLNATSLNDIYNEDERPLKRSDDLDNEYLENDDCDLNDNLDDYDIIKNSCVKSPDLHTMGNLLLPCVARQCFDVILYIQFIALLTSYALAGSQGFAQLFTIKYNYVIPFFVWILTLFIIFALNLIQPIVSLLTFFKGSLLISTVGVTFVAGYYIPHSIQTNYAAIGEPFLMGTVALGGIVNVMPLLFSKLDCVAKKIEIRRFRLSILFGLFTCTILNVFWCWAVLDIVPQEINCYQNKIINNSKCTHNYSLEASQLNGEISTIPLTSIIRSTYPQYSWIAILIRLFIVISITVSYLTIGAAMHHTIDGFISTFKINNFFSNNAIKIFKFQIGYEYIATSLTSFLAFLIVFTIAMLNPKGFGYILEKLCSFFTNAESGIFVIWMAITCRKATKLNSIPAPLSSNFYKLIIFLPIYFGFAIGYDIFTIVVEYSDIKKNNVSLYNISNSENI